MNKLAHIIAVFALIVVSSVTSFTLVLMLVAKDVSQRTVSYIPLPKAVTSQAYSNEEVLCLTRMIYGEARNQPFEGQVAVGAVAVNRSFHPNWKTNLCDVVQQPNQFKGYWAAHSPKEAEAWETASKAALQSLSVPKELVGLYYFDTGSESCRLKCKDVLVIGDHRFYK